LGLVWTRHVTTAAVLWSIKEFKLGVITCQKYITTHNNTRHELTTQIR
jgi:hypothetical protein